MKTLTIGLAIAAAAGTFALRAGGADKRAKKVDTRVFELRTYTSSGEN